jgi:DNA-binding NtrC family response regulator
LIPARTATGDVEWPGAVGAPEALPPHGIEHYYAPLARISVAAKAREIAQFEKNYIQGLLRACSGNITRAALVAQKNRRAFWQLIQKHQIDASSFKTSLSG